VREERRHIHSQLLPYRVGKNNVIKTGTIPLAPKKSRGRGQGKLEVFLVPSLIETHIKRQGRQMEETKKKISKTARSYS